MFWDFKNLHIIDRVSNNFAHPFLSSIARVSFFPYLPPILFLGAYNAHITRIFLLPSLMMMYIS